jgi:hypothetical protein
MKPPTSMTRFLGKPRVAAAVYVGCALAVLGWFGGEVPWWLGLAALCFIGTVRKAGQDLRRYNQWAGAWDAIGSAPRLAPPKPIARRRKASSPWTGVIVAALLLVIIPMVGRAPGADDTLRTGLTLLWLGMAGYLLRKLAVHVRRASFQKAAGTMSASESKTSASADVVEWVLPRASSCPSRADAMHRLPEYSGRLIAGEGKDLGFGTASGK